MPQVSVIVPVYKVEPYLHQCVDSVLTQTFTDFELILVDDGSPDNCGAICDEYAARDTRVLVIHKENGGLGNARNVGMDAAKGKYIIFLDSDDFWDERTLEVIFGEAEKNQLDALIFSGEPFWDGMEPDKGALDYRHTVQNGLVKTGQELLRIDMQHNEYFASACMRFHRLAFLRDHQLRFDEGILHEDESFSFLACVFATRAECIGDRFYKRRFRPGSIMTAKSFQKSAHGYAVAMNRIIEEVDRLDEENSLRPVFEKQVLVYMNSIQREYGKALKTQKTDRIEMRDVRGISRDCKPFLRRCRRFQASMTEKQTLSTYSLFWAYWHPTIKEKENELYSYTIHLFRPIYRFFFPKKNK